MRSFALAVASFFLLCVCLSTGAPVSKPQAKRSFLDLTDLFEVPSEGYLSYRIPCIVATKKGTIIAFTSARRAVSDWANIDIMMRRSLDGGRTWEPRRVIAQDDKNTVDNPTAIVDRDTGAIHFLYQINYARVFYMKSDDEGASFSKPVDITLVLDKYRPEYAWNVVAPGPGHAIQLRNGRLLVPIWLSTGGKSHRPSCISVLFSDDHGKTWQRGQIVPSTFKNMSESVALQLLDGRVMLNMRSEDPAYRRAVSYSADGATDWSKPVLQNELYDPICMASMIRLTGENQGDRSRILFANPDSRNKTENLRNWGSRPRENVTIKLSYDEGKTWPVSKVLEPGRGGYTDLALAPDGTIFCLYERGFIEGNNLNTKYLTVAHFNLDWLTDGKDSLISHK